MSFNAIIVGGGLAGLVSALHLSQKGVDVLLIEKHAYPRHKVCGEYVSNEVLPYLTSLGFDPFDYGAKNITDLTLSTAAGRSISTTLPLGGFGISRYCMDATLAKKAIDHGAKILHSTVVDITFENDQFEVTTNEDKRYTSEFVIGSFGKRSNLDVIMNREFIKKPSPFLAIKAHYKGEHPTSEVGLHNFEGGYCGVSKVENDLINICYLADYKTFKKYKSIDDFQQHVLTRNKFLKKTFENVELAFEKPLTISQVSFSSKEPVAQHVLMCGDAAGMIHPLAGNGMGMAISAGQMASRLIVKYLQGDIPSRQALENQYTVEWNKKFSTRLKSGHFISKLFRLGNISELLMILLKAMPFILPNIIRKTHGKPLTSI